MKKILFLLLNLVLWSNAFSQSILTQEMINMAGRNFIISENYSLEGKILRLPPHMKLIFEGGFIDNGTIQGDNTVIEGRVDNEIFGLKLIISGTWNVQNIYDTWFKFDSSKDFISNQIISNVLALANDDVKNHVYFRAPRTYYFELPYKGPANLGDKVSFTVTDGLKKANYKDLYTDTFDFLRIFTIPSNTEMTVNNVLQMLPTNQGAYFIFWEYGKQNVTVNGNGSINGDALSHIFETPMRQKTNYYGEWGMIFMCIKCNNFVFKNISLANSFGDCLFYRGAHELAEKGDRRARNLSVENVRFFNARRNGLALGVTNAYISNCHFQGCGTEKVNGTLPKSAVDFEPDEIINYPEIGNENVVMENCSFFDNFKDLSSSRNNLTAYGKIATTIRNCVFHTPIKITWAPWIRFENCIIPSFVAAQGKAISDVDPIKYVEFINCNIGELPKLVETAKYHNTFSNCLVNHRY